MPWRPRPVIADGEDGAYVRLVTLVETPSPKVVGLAWGHTDVEGLGSMKDAKLWPGGGRAWDWNETGTRHVPGIQPTDVQELLDHGCHVVVLTRGMQLRLQTCPETLDVLRDAGVEVHVEETTTAVDLYNRLTERSAVGCLIHSTC